MRLNCRHGLELSDPSQPRLHNTWLGYQVPGGGLTLRDRAPEIMHITNLPVAGVSSHPIADGSVPSVASNVRTARVTPSSMGKGSLHVGGSPGQGRVKGQRSCVKTSGYDEQQRIAVSGLGSAGGSGEAVADNHFVANARQSKTTVPRRGGGLYRWTIPDTCTPVPESLPSHRRGRVVCIQVQSPLEPIATSTLPF